MLIATPMAFDMLSGISPFFRRMADCSMVLVSVWFLSVQLLKFGQVDVWEEPVPAFCLFQSIHEGIGRTSDLCVSV